jgi:hypothetical protein
MGSDACQCQVMKITNAGSSSALSRRVSRNVPVRWGKSELTQFLQLLEDQVIATFAGMPRWFEALERVDKSLAGNVSDMFHEIDKGRRTAAMLYIRSFGTFRAAARLGLSGQLFESTVLTRSVIESGVYAWACGFSKVHREAWANRSKGESARKAAKKAFQWKSLNEMLASVDARLAAEVEKQYSEAIDFGAHPNEQGVSLSIDVTAIDGDKRTSINTIFAHGPDAIRLAVLGLLRAMHLLYRLLSLTIGDRLRILGIDKDVQDSARFILRMIEEQERKTKRS